MVTAKKSKLTFFDVKSKRKFSTSNYKVVKRRVRGRVRKFAVAKSPYSGIKCWRVLRG